MFLHVEKALATILLLATLLSPVWARAATVEYDLTIAENEVNYSGRPAQAMTVNGGIPGPVLEFTEGDLARIRVHNAMSIETSVHWHGVLVPPEMDGVPLVSFPPIAPGSTFTYEFPIRQSGTYWYHSHTSLQEQSGVYGAIKILPRSEDHTADLDRVVMLSDWTDVEPHEVLRTLKRGSDWMALEKGSAQSIFGAMKLGMLGDYFARELQRMPAMDIADISYDRFLANGQPELTMADAGGKTLRLRIVNGGAGTNFYLEYSGGPMTIISADGQPVEPVEETRFLIAIAETYDVLVRVPADGAFELRATAQDGSGYASIWLGAGERYAAPDIPKPNLYQGMGSASLRQVFVLTPAGTMGMSDNEVRGGKFDTPGMAGMSMEMEGMDHGSGMAPMVMPGMDHSSQEMRAGSMSKEVPQAELESLFDEPQTAVTSLAKGRGTEHAGHMLPAMQNAPTGEIAAGHSGKRFGSNFRPLAADVSSAGPLAVDGMSAARPWPPYEKLRAPRSTSLPAGKPVREIRLTLDGDMERYVWFLNNKPLSESDAIRIREGEVVRFIMINRTMMHHPMHLHGHFFRVLNGQGDHAPLKHTVDVAPMSTTVIEFDANEVGDWFFHCHLLYHMKSGMARVVSYENFTLNPQLAAIRPKLYQDSSYAWGQAEILSNMSEGFVTTANTRNNLSAEWEIGWGQVDETEWEALLTWDRYINRFFTVFAGADIGNAIEEDRAVAGLRYLLPFMLETSAFVGSDGEARVTVARMFELMPRLSLDGLVQYDTDSYWEYIGGISYTLTKDFSLRAQWHSDYRWGAGLQVRF
ncbi:Copper resistance protein A precursor [Desulfuromonas sp. DDH964]|jgi:CopA family copper-resistance protein|uniref:multicopper oxidase domain-containing protein n=1 Tax=Desulfuromonas sp. DDH964 TaxID=1823759 RepID=UPI00078BA073|nr:multicopper oxidase domain-containing protein [Desulfuromonas sp. DDH964]AMV70606.1 Copper resistance protein A precursor [Desulfuromonas sp. DDH964]